MKRYISGVGFGLVLAIVGLFAYGAGVYAQSLSIGANPANPKADNLRSQNIFILKLKPGETAKDGIQVSNPTKMQRTVNLGVVDAGSSVDGSFSCLQNSEKKKGVGNWIALDKKQVTLEPGTQEVVGFTVTTPSNAGPGEHGGCITFQDTKSYAKTSGSGIQLGFRGAIRVAVTVPGKIRKELTIVRIDTKRNEDGSYMVSPVAKNSGNVSLDVNARVQLKSIFGQKSRILDDAKYPIMPDSTTGWPYRFERPFWGGFYKAYTSLSYNADPNAGIGERMGDTKKTSKVSSNFFMIPAPQAIAVYVAAILLPVLLLVIWLRNKRKKATLGKKWETYLVEAGDSLTAIAAERGIKWKRLAKMNRIKPPYGLMIGQELLVPRVHSGRSRINNAAQPATSQLQPSSLGRAEQGRISRQYMQQNTQIDTALPVDPRDIPWPSQEEEYRAWQATRSVNHSSSADSRASNRFQNPYHGDEDPAELAESWNGPSQEMAEQHGAVESPADVPAMHWMWDDLADEPKKSTQKKTTSKAAERAKPRRNTKPIAKKTVTPKRKARK
ncbi:MAG: LysM protein [Patescibacteria group bacterium]|nr:DUF916 domain-containing protein [Candidatus Saccharibacteria bacterium]MDQ5963558.1 LysM protein [Patescibacteria group bacterium]